MIGKTKQRSGLSRRTFPAGIAGFAVASPSRDRRVAVATEARGCRARVALVSRREGFAGANPAQFAQTAARA